jgi:hypothetical protein
VGVSARIDSAVWHLNGISKAFKVIGQVDVFLPVIDFVVADYSPTDNVVGCSFFFRSYTEGNPGNLGLEGTPISGTTGEPGVTTLNLAISQVVDNNAHSYYVGCTLDDSGQTSIVQIEVQYTTTGNLIH